MEEPREVKHWKNICCLGSGAFGIVSLWENQATSEYLAIKKCKFQSHGKLTDRQRQRWESEVQIMKSLNCQNIVSFKELPPVLDQALSEFNPTKLPLLSMEYCKKGNLRHILTQPRHSCGLQEPDVREVLSDITHALGYLHKLKITHRDIKPENIVLQETSSRTSGIIYKLIDLGYAKELNDSIGSFVGTLHYLAPEIIKTESYNCSVDYWSLGILSFEVICGVLPFLPQFTPFKRFQYIEKKRPEHICIYQLHSGSISSSSEILKENHISEWLKQNVEIWLRHGLQFDPKMRSMSFPDTTNVFEYLLNVLRKKVITVFSVTTLEFYSYEINDSTLIGTLKSWIARDTKVQNSDQILLTNLKTFRLPDDKFVVNLITEEDAMIYVFKKGFFINRDMFNLPKHVRLLFENCTKTYKWGELKPIYIKSRFYLAQEDRLVYSLLTAFKLLVEFTRSLTEKLKSYLTKITDFMKKVLVKLECYYKIHKDSKWCVSDINIKRKSEYESILLCINRLLAGLERSVNNTNKLRNKVIFFTKRQLSLDSLYGTNIGPIINACDTRKLLDEATEILGKTATNPNQDLMCTDMVKIVSKAMKEKDKLLNNKNFHNYAKATSIAVRDSEILLTWMSEFENYVIDLNKSIDESQSAQFRALIGASNMNSKTSKIIGPFMNGCTYVDADSAISENQELRFLFEEVFNSMSFSHQGFFSDLSHTSL